MSENGQETKIIELPISITVRELAQTLDASPIEVIKTLMANGMMANINQEIDFDTAAIVSAEMGYEAIPIQVEEDEELEEVEVPLWRQKLEEEDQGQLETRPPVVAILGHVERYALILFIPYYLDFLLPLRKGMRVEAFAKLNGDGSFEPPYDGIFDTTHLAIHALRRIKKRVYEKDVVLFILGFELLLAALCVLIFVL